MNIQKQIGLLACVLLFAACETAYYDAMEKVGVHKRDIFVDRVEGAMESQEEAKEEFKNALEAFSAVVDVKNSELKSVYEDLNDAFEDAEDQASEVTERIDGVESVSDALFEEWQEELSAYTNADYRRRSADQLKSTRLKYKQLLKSMRSAESRMKPVLDVFRDQVLFLKHNLNAQAVASLKGELGRIENDVAILIRDMEVSIKRSQAFINELESGGAT